MLVASTLRDDGTKRLNNALRWESKVDPHAGYSGRVECANSRTPRWRLIYVWLRNL